MTVPAPLHHAAPPRRPRTASYVLFALSVVAAAVAVIGSVIAELSAPETGAACDQQTGITLGDCTLAYHEGRLLLHYFLLADGLLLLAAALLSVCAVVVRIVER